MKRKSSKHSTTKTTAPTKHRILKPKRMDEDMDFLEDSTLEEIEPDTQTNWSQAQDRSEDLINETDPLIQDPKLHKTPRDDRF